MPRLLLSVIVLAACGGEVNIRDKGPGEDGADGGASGGDGGPAPDADEDGVPADEDCDDTNSRVYPGADERCDGWDNDCDGLTDADDDSLSDGTVAYADVDADTWGDDASPLTVCALPAGAATRGGDCDDTDAAIAPDAAEVCNGTDDDCDALVDDFDPDLTGAFVVFTDGDGDLWGDDATAAQVCTLPPGAVTQGGDCDDATPDVYPGAPEACDEVDADCDGDLEDPDATGRRTFAADADGDGYAAAGAPTVERCTAPAGFVEAGGDCDDTTALASPAGAEACDDAIDNDCSGATDCDDAACLTDAACYESSCTDGVDNDRNGLTDCDDPQCADGPDCFSSCASADLGSAIGVAVATGTTTGGTSTFGTPSECSSLAGRGPDDALVWTAPADGCYAWSLEDSAFDTVLRIFDSCTGGTELACDDDFFTGGTSGLAAEVPGGLSVILVVDGYGTSSAGAWSLDIYDLSVIADATLTSGSSASATATFNAALHGSDADIDAASCAGTGYDVIYAFTPTNTGTHAVDTAGSTFDTVLSVHEGTCGTEVACDDDVSVFSDTTSALTVEMTAGTVYFLRVAGYDTAETGSLRLRVAYTP
jgi:hypothetical protein